MWNTRLPVVTYKVREGGRAVNVHCLVATGVNADGYREIPGIDVTSSQGGAGWLAFLRGLAARGPTGSARGLPEARVVAGEIEQPWPSVVVSLAHMHVNRMLGVERASEVEVYALLRSALRSLLSPGARETVIARGKVSS